ncbi:MAG TPA: 2OG-Fe(II) oxygenase [Allosphingosinicella sp.]
MLSFPAMGIVPLPFPHAAHPDFLPAGLYQRLKSKFPVCPPLGGPTGFSYFRGDPAYDSLVAEDPDWRIFAQTLHSQAFIDYCLGGFAAVLAAEECLVPLERARFADHFESRGDKFRREVRIADRPAEDLWVRLDILQGRKGYAREAHLDHRRRLVTMLIYFCDSDHIGMTGGDLVLHVSPDDEGLLRYPPRDNLMVAFPCSPRSWHSVSRIVAQQKTRDFVQITISSPADAWPSD